MRENWKEGIVLCSACYIRLVKNPLRRGVKQSNNAIDELESNKKLELSEAIEIMANFFYDREYKKKESTIYSFEEMRKLLEEYDSNLKYFFLVCPRQKLCT